MYNQRQLTQESLTSQDQDLKLYEQICRQLLPDKELNRILEKSKYDEENEEWIIPFIKQSKSASDNLATSYASPSSNNRAQSRGTTPKSNDHSLQTSSSTNGPFLPSINSSGNGQRSMNESRSTDQILPSLLPPSGSRVSTGTNKGPEIPSVGKPKKKQKKSKKNKEYVSI